MGVAKIMINSIPLIDVTSDTVDVNTLAEEYIAMSSDGAFIDGTQPATVNEDTIIERAISGVYSNPRIAKAKYGAFAECAELVSVKAKKLYQLDHYAFYGCSSLTEFVMRGNNGTSNNGSGIRTISCFEGCTSLRAVDLKYKYGNGVYNTIGTNSFCKCSRLTTLVFRQAYVYTLSNINAFTGTPFASGGSGGTIYIPKSLYDKLGTGSSDYKATTNWSTIDGYGTITWAPIEGSEYEHFYVDGTPIEEA